MSVHASPVLCYLCFEALENALMGAERNEVWRAVGGAPAPIVALFVTWKTLPGHALRGCIGNFAGLPLFEGLRDYALKAAFRDRRFSAISPEELPQLECGVSVLHSFEDAADAFDWEIGVHGIRLFIGEFTATYLPEVAASRGWTKRETLQHLARKAGFPSALTEEVTRSARVVRYQSSKCVASWDEFCRWRDSR